LRAYISAISWPLSLKPFGPKIFNRNSAVQNNPDIMIAARFGSPLILGVGENEWFVASDASAFLEYTRQVMLHDFGFVSFLPCHFASIHPGAR
jgi:hypothetical protein